MSSLVSPQGSCPRFGDRADRRRVGGIAGRVGLRLAAVVLCALVVVSAAMLLDGGPAWASSERGHVFAGAFAAAGSSSGDLSDAAGVAVSEATGDVYVIDRGNDRVERFGPQGEFISVWGWGVSDGAGEYEVCTSSCEAGIGGAGKAQLDRPLAVAVDNSRSPADPSRGDVYVITSSRVNRSRIEKFSPEGAWLGRLKQAGTEARWEGTLDGVSVDGNGTVWAYRADEGEGYVERFTDGAKNEFVEPALEPRLEPRTGVSEAFCAQPGFAVDETGEHVYAAREHENSVEGCPEAEGEARRPVVAAELGLSESGEELTPLLSALDPQPASAIAVEGAGGPDGGAAYVDNEASIGVFDGSSGALVQRVRRRRARALGRRRGQREHRHGVCVRRDGGQDRCVRS